jgi:AcrR family transcriptional regulator
MSTPARKSPAKGTSRKAPTAKAEPCKEPTAEPASGKAGARKATTSKAARAEPVIHEPGTESAGPRPSGSGRPRRPNRRDLILAAAADLFEKNGFAATGIDDIGAAAGIIGPGVYRHFASKDEILITLAYRAGEELLTIDEVAQIELEEPPEVALRRLVTRFVTNTLEHGSVAFVAWNEARNLAPQTRAWLDRRHRLFAAEWIHVLSRLRPDRTDLELFTMVNAVYGMVIEALHQESGLDRQRAREVLVAMALRTLLPAVVPVTEEP